MITYRSFNNFDRSLFRKDVSDLDWPSVDSNDDPNDLWFIWKTKFLSVANKHAPLRTKRIRSNKHSPWITASLKRSMRSRDVLKIKAINSKNPHDWALYKRARNEVNSEIKRAKQSHYQERFAETLGDSSITW